MNCWREFLALPAVQDVHDGEIVVNVPAGIGNHEDFTVAAWLVVGSLHSWPPCRAAIAEGPLAKDYTAAGVFSSDRMRQMRSRRSSTPWRLTPEMAWISLPGSSS